MQLSLSDSPVLQLPMRDASVFYHRSWLSKEQADMLMAIFLQELDWQEAYIQLFGKQTKVPRLQAWYGDPQATYTYSGLQMTPLAWTATLQQLKQQCERACGQAFNSVLANLYRDGQDSMGMHADNEPELGAQPCIASLSLGASRNFDFKHVHSGEKHRVVLEHGSLLVMQGDTQQYWQHGINKTKRCDAPRINFTFRWVDPAYASKV